MVDLEWLGSLWASVAARTGGLLLCVLFSSLADQSYQKVLVDCLVDGGYGVCCCTFLVLAAKHLGLGGLDLSELIVSSFVGYFNLK